ncbi:MAG: ATP-binding protein [Dehalococcoidia bacterium]
MTPHEPDAWEVFANGLLQYHAVLRRLSGVPPRDFAGLVIEDEEVDRLLAELPGLDGPLASQLEPARKKLAPQLEALRKRLHASVTKDTTFSRIVRNAHLNKEDTEAFAVIAAVDLGPQRQRLVGYLQDNVNATRLWLSSLEMLFPWKHPGAKVVADGSALGRAELVTITGDGPWGTRSVSLADRVAWALSGDDAPEPSLPPRSRIISSSEVRQEGDDLIAVAGADRSSRLKTAVARLKGSRFLVLPVPSTDQAWRAAIREASVSGLSIILEVETAMPEEAAEWIDRARHLPWAISSRTEPPLDVMPSRPWREYRVESGSATSEDWLDMTGSPPKRQHRLNREQLRLVSLATRSMGGDVDAAVRRLSSGHLDRLAVHVRPRRGWNDLVLPPHQERQLREIVARYRHRSTVYDTWEFRPVPSAGVVSLFSGPSGTGKTLAAEILAAELKLDMYRIDLSSVVSKYIGETEKNLEQIFDAASASNLVLFFDEADALFGKRSEVSDAHDRYANIEVAYLLQRLEMYEGIVILATNLQGNIDHAFMRRIHVSIDFPVPGEEERRRIWKLSFPEAAPTEDIDVDFLARQFKITGGNIRNAALAGAFLAAEAGTPITMEHVIRGLEREFEKLGRLRTREDFGQYLDALKERRDAPPN